MATVIKNVVTSAGTEKAFITAIINRISALDLGFTCDTTVDAQFVSGATPTFGFSTPTFPGFLLRLTRATSLTYNTNYYNIYMIINGETKASGSAYYAASTIFYNNAATRSFFTNSVVDDAGHLFLWFGSYNVQAVTGAGVVAICLTAPDGQTYCGGYGSPNIELASLYKSGDASVEYKIASGISFAATPGYLEYLDYVVFTNSGQEVFRLNNLLNSTQITQGTGVSINDDIYYAVGPHTLIALD